MNIIANQLLKYVSGGMASMSFGPDGTVSFVTTGTSVNKIGGSVNGVPYNMAMYPDHITTLDGKLIFEGTSGSFSYNGYNYVVSPVDGGSMVTPVGPC